MTLADYSSPRLWCLTALLASQAGCLALPGVGGEEVVPVRPPVSALVPVRFDAPADTLPSPRAVEQQKAADKLESGRGLTLDQAINATLLHDPKIRAGLELIAQANGDALTASLSPNPTLSVNQTLLPLTRPFTVDRQGGPPQLDVGVAYPIDWCVFGKQAAMMVSAGLGVRVSEADFADLIRQRVRETSQEFYNVLEARALLELARNDLQTKQQTEEIIRKARAAGGRTEVDLDRIRLETLLSRQVVRESEANVSSSVSRLRALTGRRDFEALGVAGELGDAPKDPVPDLRDAVSLAQKNRPDIRSDHWKIAQADADTRVEDVKACPEVTTRIGYTRQFQQKAIGFPDADSYGVGVDISLPICNRNQGNRLKARSVASQRRHELEGDLVDLRSEVELIVVEYRTALRTAEVYADVQTELARKVRDRIQEAFRLGSRTLLEVLDAQRAYRETLRSSINSRAAAWRALYKLRSATGSQVSTHERTVPEPVPPAGK